MKKALSLLFASAILLVGCGNKTKNITIHSEDHFNASFEVSDIKYDFNFTMNSDDVFALTIKISNYTNKVKTFNFSDIYFQDDSKAKQYVTVFPSSPGEFYPDIASLQNSANKLKVAALSTGTVRGGTAYYQPIFPFEVSLHARINNLNIAITDIFTGPI